MQAADDPQQCDYLDLTLCKNVPFCGRAMDVVGVKCTSVGTYSPEVGGFPLFVLSSFSFLSSFSSSLLSLLFLLSYFSFFSFPLFFLFFLLFLTVTIWKICHLFTGKFTYFLFLAPSPLLSFISSSRGIALGIPLSDSSGGFYLRYLR